MKLLGTNNTNKHKTHNNIRRSRRRKTYTILNNWNMKITNKKSLHRGRHKAMKNILFYQWQNYNKKRSRGRKRTSIKRLNWNTKTNQKVTKSKSLTQEVKSRKTKQDNTYQEENSRLWDKAWVNNETTKYLGDADRGRQRHYTHEGGRHRCKQSGIRDDVRPGTQEEGHVIWNEREVTFKIKHESTRQTPRQDNLTAMWHPDCHLVK